MSGSHLGGVAGHVQRTACRRSASQGRDGPVAEINHYLVHRHTENFSRYLGQGRRLAGTDIGNRAANYHGAIHLDADPGLTGVLHPTDTAVTLLVAGNAMADPGSLGICWPLAQGSQGLGCALIRPDSTADDLSGHVGITGVDEIAPPHLHGIHAQCFGDLLHLPLTGKIGLHGAKPPEGTGRQVVGGG